MNRVPFLVLALLATGCQEYELSQHPPALGDAPETTVPAPDSKTAPSIWIVPDAYDFGAPWIGCPDETIFEIRNKGDADLVVDDLMFEAFSDELSFTHDLSLPVTIAPGEFVEVTMGYTGEDLVDDFGEFVAHSNDPEAPEASGTAHAVGKSQRVTESFDQPTQPQSDILVVVDNSCSMTEEQANLTANFQSFMDTIVAANADYRIGVITTDSPAFRGGIITPATPNPVGTFTGQANAGINGSGSEMPLQMIYQATLPGGDAAPGGAFFRDDAVLSIVIVTDEPDDYSLTSPQDTATYLANLKGGDTSLVRVHTIGGDVPMPACATAAAGSVPMDQVSGLTGGLFLSVCNNWGTSLNAVAQGSVPTIDRWTLAQPAQPGTIEITVDGTRNTQWTYDSASNTVEFNAGFSPAEGAVVEIAYEPYHECN